MGFIQIQFYDSEEHFKKEQALFTKLVAKTTREFIKALMLGAEREVLAGVVPEAALYLKMLFITPEMTITNKPSRE